VWVCACGWPNPTWREACECCWREREQQEAQPPGFDSLSGLVLNGDDRKVIEGQELLQVFQDIQQREMSDGTIPASPRTIIDSR
jgi:hypothetical protein